MDDTATKSPQTGPASRFFFSQRLKLHYVDWGNPDAPPLILQHGGKDHCRSWDWVANRLRHDWHVIAPDLRGHGDSEWSVGSGYGNASFLYDLAQLIDQQKLEPVTIVAHSFGGSISLRYAGIYPEKVRKIAVIEGALYGPQDEKKPIRDRLEEWIEAQRRFSALRPHKYRTIEEACKRMHDQNKRLTAGQARHLTENAVNQNEDSTYSWKFDANFQNWPPYDMIEGDIQALWQNIACPMLQIYGKESWYADLLLDGRMNYFKTARLEAFDNAEHWVHHDRLEDVVALLKEFL